MLEKLQKLDWIEKGGFVNVRLPLGDFKEILFPIDDDMINYLVSNTPKIVYLFVALEGEMEERVFYVDFEGLRPLVSVEDALRVKVDEDGNVPNRLKEQGFVSVGRYCFARGESYTERFLSPEGWLRQKTYQDIYRNEERKQVPVAEPVKVEPVQTAVKSESLLSERLKPCVKCGQNINISDEVCPQCEAEQFQKCTACNNKVGANETACPHCGTELKREELPEKPEDDGMTISFDDDFGF